MPNEHENAPPKVLGDRITRLLGCRLLTLAGQEGHEIGIKRQAALKMPRQKASRRNDDRQPCYGRAPPQRHSCLANASKASSSLVGATVSRLWPENRRRSRSPADLI